jgi:hypothetical protein
VTGGRGRQRNITVRAVLRPEIDYAKLARALLGLVSREDDKSAADQPEREDHP